MQRAVHYVVSTTHQLMGASKNSLQSLEKLERLFEDFSHKKVFNILVEHLYRAEAVSPLSADLMIKRLVGDKIDSSRPRSCHKDDLKRLLVNASDEKISELVLDAFDLVGLKGKLSIGKSNSIDLIELIRGYLFEELTPAFQTGNIELSQPKSISIDGYIESVSEIHHILENLSSSKDSAVLFVRGLSNEVLHTLKVNYDRKTVLCVPIVVKYDLEGVNVLNDISVICGNDVVSSFKGQTISSIDCEKYNRIDSIKISNNTVLIVAKDSSARVDRHVSFLQKKIQEEDNQISQEVLTKRIKRLGGNQANILLVNDDDFVKKSFMIDRCIRSVKSSHKGIVEIFGKVYLNTSIATSKLYADKFMKTVNDIGCIVY